MSDQLVYRLADLVQVISLSKSTIYELIQREDFPSPVRLTARTVGWRAKDIAAWLEARPKSTNRHPADDSA